MKILLFRSNNIFASRVNKYVNYYKRIGVDYTIVGWDRKGEGLEKSHYEFWNYKAGTAVGGLKAIKNHTKWMIFVYKYLKKHKDTTTVHACDLNVAFPASLYKYIHKRDLVVIFDACDWFSSNFAKYPMLAFFFKLMEKFSCNISNALIICEPERRRQITFRLKENPFILPNIPEIELNLDTRDCEKYKFNNNNLTLAYFGGLVVDRFLEEVLELSKSESFNLLIAGFGDARIEKLCADSAKRQNVKFFGKLGMVEGLKMTKEADIVFAMYCKNNPNHIYAAPNKYYEAMYLGKPIISTKGTIIEDKIIANNNGWAIEENIDDLRYMLCSITKDDIRIKGQNMIKIWNNQYNSYVQAFFNNEYSSIIK